MKANIASLAWVSGVCHMCHSASQMRRIGCVDGGHTWLF
eukprot:CAMPEP_0202914836 /NCGR_PEP_ID=MMETSP1392-20130828/64172_1 /ASSEMBLY_ACC=CAM_ASM_000868 /TAXON_ID=225041 /ORGANISM="Chlamydomonas chlamydogama, Strain SAG 11-48b" /LENGTH=38 /DNA_ID= /DNA_START= /DNA_END= /DNA_ORIENTATION=